MRTASAAQRTGPAHHAHGFGRHLIEMGLAMMVGMIVSAAIFLSAVGMTAEEADARARGAVRRLTSARDDGGDGRLDAPPAAQLAKLLGDGNGDGRSRGPTH